MKKRIAASALVTFTGLLLTLWVVLLSPPKTVPTLVVSLPDETRNIRPLRPATTTTTTTTVAPVMKSVSKNTSKPPAPATIPAQCEQFREIVARYFPADQVNNALFVASKESGCTNHQTPSPTNDYGFFQVNFPAHKNKVGGNPELLKDLETNVRVASQIYQGSWRPWYAVCPLNGSNPYGIC